MIVDANFFIVLVLYEVSNLFYHPLQVITFHQAAWFDVLMMVIKNQLIIKTKIWMFFLFPLQSKKMFVPKQLKISLHDLTWFERTPKYEQ